MHWTTLVLRWLKSTWVVQSHNIQSYTDNVLDFWAHLGVQVAAFGSVGIICGWKSQKFCRACLAQDKSARYSLSVYLPTTQTKFWSFYPQVTQQPLQSCSAAVRHKRTIYLFNNTFPLTHEHGSNPNTGINCSLSKGEFRQSLWLTLTHPVWCVYKSFLRAEPMTPCWWQRIRALQRDFPECNRMQRGSVH